MMSALKLNVDPAASTIPALPDIPQGDTIPKIIHQTNRPKPWPAQVDYAVDRLKAANPDWDYRFYGDDQHRTYIQDQYGPDILGYYDRIDPRYGAAQADLFRYLLMYREGGVYLDIKSGVNRSLSEAIDLGCRFILAEWPQGDAAFEGFGRHMELKIHGVPEFQQWHIICAPGHPFLRNVLQTVLRNIDVYNPILHETGKPGVLKVTGPVPYSLAIAPLMATQQFCKCTMEDVGLVYTVELPGEHVPYDHKLSPHHYSRLHGIPVIRQPQIVNVAFEVLRAGKRAASKVWSYANH